MIGYLLNHLTQIVMLAVILVTGILVFTEVESIFTKFGLIALISFFYFIFGLFHHLQEKTLSLNIIFEYLILSVLLLWTMLALSLA